MLMYAERMRRLGHVQVKVWVPSDMSDWLYTFADDARRLHEEGGDPVTYLPAKMFRLAKVRRAIAALEERD
jgi:hypothetical protein